MKKTKRLSVVLSLAGFLLLLGSIVSFCRLPNVHGSVNQVHQIGLPEFEAKLGPPSIRLGAYGYWVFEDGIAGVRCDEDGYGQIRASGDRLSAAWNIVRLK